MAADGCLINDKRHIDITSKDTEIIGHVQSISGTKAKPTLKVGGFGAAAYRLMFSDVALYDFLQAAGITPAKSKIMKSLDVPNVYYADFLRGIFDGDGTTYGYQDPYWNCHKYYVAFASASMDFLVWLKATNRHLLLTSRGAIYPSKAAFQLTYGKDDSQKLFSAMYHPDHVHKLIRKYTKLRDFISSDPYAKITVDARVLE